MPSDPYTYVPGSSAALRSVPSLPHATKLCVRAMQGTSVSPYEAFIERQAATLISDSLRGHVVVGVSTLADSESSAVAIEAGGTGSSS